MIRSKTPNRIRQQLARSTFAACLVIAVPALANDPVLPDTAPPDQSEVLPAGSYFTPTVYPTLCPECVRPVAGVILWRATRAEAESSLARTAGDGNLAPGYPVVLHTNEMGLSALPTLGCNHEGGPFAVILALFSSIEDAQQWQAESAYATDSVIVEFAEVAPTPSRDWVRTVHVDIDLNAVTADALNQVTYNQLIGVEPYPELPTACEITAGSVFTIPSRQMYTVGYPWVPVRCGETIAYVPRHATRIDTVIIDGQIRQVTDVQCDTARVESWPVDSARDSPGTIVSDIGCAP